jgi:hypothetical protein
MAYLDGELPVRDRSAVESHLGGCRPCQSDLDDLRGMAAEFTTAIGLADGAIPMLKARARLQPHVAAGHRPAVAARMGASGLLKAAAVVLLVAGAGSAAIPGTPLNRLVGSMLDPDSTPVASDAADAPFAGELSEPVIAAPPTEEQRLPGAEFGVQPVAGQGRVSIHGPAEGATIAVRLVDSTRLVRVAAIRADDTRFESGEGYVEVFGNTTGLIVEVPRNLASMTVEVDGRLYFVKDGDQTRAVGPGSAAGPDEFVFQARSR